MAKRLLMGNQAIALAAIASGVNVVCGYPGTPSTEVLETVAKNNPGHIHVEWSINEKAALELAAGASMGGARTLVTMKQMGLNVAADPLMVVSYLGVKGGMVVLVADDPGPISSQTEQDTRTFAQFSRVPVFDPSSPEEAYQMCKDAFEFSERYGTPVFLRPTTRVCHACASLEPEEPTIHTPAGFEKRPEWVVFPALSRKCHEAKDKTLAKMADDLCDYPANLVVDVDGPDSDENSEYHLDTLSSPYRKRGIVTGGVSDAYALEALSTIDASYRFMHVATPFPFPEALATDFLEGLDEVLVVEELDPYLERELLRAAGAHHLPVIIHGKLDGTTKGAGENTTESVRADIERFLGKTPSVPSHAQTPDLPIRPPVLCPGCPHRGAFFAVKRALRGRKAVYSGDIGCYTLGNAAPLDMVDTCLCMGAGITQAQGLSRVDPEAANIAFVGDSTFFASGITGVINAYYNENDITLIVLDNSTTAMTGMQPHPGTGHNAMGKPAPKVSIDSVLRGIGLTVVEHADPLDFEASIAAVKRAVDFEGISAVIFESPCAQLIRGGEPYHMTDACTSCKVCINLLGCPGLVFEDEKVSIDPTLCNGCGLCAQICPHGAIATPDPSDSDDKAGDAR